MTIYVHIIRIDYCNYLIFRITYIALYSIGLSHLKNLKEYSLGERENVIILLLIVSMHIFLTKDAILFHSLHLFLNDSLGDVGLVCL